MRIKKGDQVLITTGKDKGKKGEVLRVYPKTEKVLVEKVNYRTVYLRKSQEHPNGGITQVEAPIHVSNVQFICPRTNKPTRLAYSILADGTKHRLSKKSGEVL